MNFVLGMCHFLNPSLFEIQDCLMLTNGSKMQHLERIISILSLAEEEEKGGEILDTEALLGKILTSNMVVKQQHIS